ncbi:hypothetical protein [Desulfothermobacter acidiphilus]|uniref:hypothetical protein n=1 Tax=Desulfothermobacter acidiphilus TaxID=1938353 RepID=UPI003F8C890D
MYRSSWTLAWLLVLWLLPAWSWAHAPGDKPPISFEGIAPIVWQEGDKRREISFKDAVYYHGTKMGTGSSVLPGMLFSYRALQAGLEELWGQEIPRPEDLQVESALPDYSSVVCLQYLLGDRGKLALVLPDGTRVDDLSYRNLSQLSRELGPEHYRLSLTRLSTGQRVTVQAKKDLFPPKYFELRRKVLYHDPQKATEQEGQALATLEVAMVAKMAQGEPWELFEGFRQPFPVISGLITGGVLLVVVAGFTLPRFRRR